MIRVDRIRYCRLSPASSTDADTAANALLNWSAAFGVPNGLMSDSTKHFEDETVRLLTNGLHTPYFRLPYFPSYNDSIQRLGKKLLCVACELLSELHMRQDDWP